MTDKDEDEIVKKLRPNPSKPSLRTVALEGFEGSSNIEGFRALYDTRKLDSYYTIAENDIVSKEKIHSGGTRLYVKEEACPEYTVSIPLTSVKDDEGRRQKGLTSDLKSIQRVLRLVPDYKGSLERVVEDLDSAYRITPIPCLEAKRWALWVLGLAKDSDG